uniref:Uncharacterized protein n=1 Tax=Erpetoichthys calabaricus TaxID=27687 RepID=A0A8C4SQL3_ERPCA
MFDRASLKLGLDKAVLQSMSGRENSVGGIQQLSKKEIEDLLRRGAYGAIMDEEDEGSKFCEEDIDQILQRRTKTITIESEGRGSTFAKVNQWKNLLVCVCMCVCLFVCLRCLKLIIAVREYSASLKISKGQRKSIKC